MKFIDRSEYYTRTHTHPNSEETRSKVRNVTQQEINKLVEICGFKLERHHIGANKALISDRYPIKFNIGINYIKIWVMEDEWFIVDIDHYKYPAMFKCDQLEGVKLLIDDIRISYSILSV